MFLIAHESIDDAKVSAQYLASLGGAALRLLAECVAEQGVKRKSLSAAAIKLEEVGFVFIRNISDIVGSEYAITPSLKGEEALELLDNQKEGAGRVAINSVTFCSEEDELVTIPEPNRQAELLKSA